VGPITAPPDDQGWQVAYQIGIQDLDIVVTAISIAYLPSLINPVAPRGGLTAQRARSIIKPGTALQEFATQVARGRVMPELSDKEVKALMDGRESWRAQPTPAFLTYLRTLQALPEIAQFLRGKPRSRQQRIAQTAAMFVQARDDERHPAPRKRVAERQGRDEAAVRDDLYAARHQSPAILTGAGGQGRTGGVLTDEARAILKAMETSRAPKKGATRRKKSGPARPGRKGGKR
jgi:hypothetical protein